MSSRWCFPAHLDLRILLRSWAKSFTLWDYLCPPGPHYPFSKNLLYCGALLVLLDSLCSLAELSLASRATLCSPPLRALHSLGLSLVLWGPLLPSGPGTLSLGLFLREPSACIGSMIMRWQKKDRTGMGKPLYPNLLSLVPSGTLA